MPSEAGRALRAPGFAPHERRSAFADAARQSRADRSFNTAVGMTGTAGEPARIPREAPGSLGARGRRERAAPSRGPQAHTPGRWPGWVGA